MKRITIKKIIKLAVLIGGGVIVIGGIVMGITGLWPIARVGYTPITYNTFKNNFMMADHYYRSNVKIAGEDEAVIDAKEVQQELQRATMEGLVEQILIVNELEKKYSKEDLRQLIDNKMGKFDLSAEDMKKAIELQYGLTPEQFRELRLLPKAEQELLEGNITLQNGTFDGWLTTKKAEANVSIFVPALYWDGTGVRVK